MTDSILGSIVYLNGQEVENLLESLEGGLVDQFRETTKESIAKKGEGGASFPGTEIGLKGGVEKAHEEEREAVRRHTSVSRLSALRKRLIADGTLAYINAVDENARDDLATGQLVEVHGDLTVPGFDEFVEQAAKVVNWVKVWGPLWGITRTIDSETEQRLAYFQEVVSKGVPVYVQPATVSGARRGYDFACILAPENLRVKRDELAGSANVLGRVRKVLASNEVIYFHELFPTMPSIPRQQFKALINDLQKSQQTWRIEERDLRIRYPTVLLTPLAVYS